MRRSAFDRVQLARVLTPPPDVRPSEWIEANISLLPGKTSRPGPWSWTNSPAVRGLVNIASKPGVVEMAVMKGAQVGVSEGLLRAFICYTADHDPDPVLLVMPDEQKGRKVFEERWLPLFRTTPALRALATGRAHDQKKNAIVLANGFSVSLAWSGSASALATDPCRIVAADELDKWQPIANEAHPFYLARARTVTFEHRRLVLAVSTPTTRHGMIAVLFYTGSTVQLYGLVACPACGARQRLMPDGIKWAKPESDDSAHDRRAHAREIIDHPERAWYECAACAHAITETERRRALHDMKWGTCGDDNLADGVIDDAEAVEAFPPETRVGVHLPSMYSVHSTCALHAIAAQWIEALGNRERLLALRTNVFGLPFEDVAARVKAGDIHERAAAARLPELCAPWWTARVLATIDTQHDHFWFDLRAWGPDLRSGLLWAGRVESFDELDRRLFQSPVRCEDDRLPAFAPAMALIDSGGTKLDTDDAPGGRSVSRTMAVYRWALDRSAVVRVIKGDNRPRPGEYIRRGSGAFVAERRDRVPLWLLDVQHFQDELADLLRRRVPTMDADPETGEAIDEPAWQVCAFPDTDDGRRRLDTYATHLSNLRKVAIPDRSGGVAERWERVGPGARVDLRDCEGYQVAAAYMAGVHQLPGIHQYHAALERDVAAAAAHRSRAAELRAAGPAGRWARPDGGSFISSRD